MLGIVGTAVVAVLWRSVVPDFRKLGVATAMDGFLDRTRDEAGIATDMASVSKIFL